MPNESRALIAQRLALFSHESRDQLERPQVIRSRLP